MIKNLVFDMGNVCCYFDIDYIAKKLTNNLYDQAFIKQNVFASKQWQQLDAGTISLKQAEKEIVQKVGKDQLIHQALYHWYDYFEQDEQMFKFLLKLKAQGFHLYLLSNCSLQFYEYYQHKEIFSCFDGYYISARHHLMKPDLAIYLDFLAEFKLEARQCVFIDDILENVVAAKKAQMLGIHYLGNINHLHTQLENILKKS